MLALALGFSLVAAISADGPPAYGPAPAYAPAPSYEKEVPQPYQYQYGVQDDYSGANFAASENSDANVVTGTYTVHLPDGRIQTVKYTADHYNGYVADVTVSSFYICLKLFLNTIIIFSMRVPQSTQRLSLMPLPSMPLLPPSTPQLPLSTDLPKKYLTNDCDNRLARRASLAVLKLMCDASYDIEDILLTSPGL